MTSIKKLLELGDKRTQGEWEATSSYSAMVWGGFISNARGRDAKISINLHTYESAEGTHDAEYIASTPKMEAKLREMVVELLPEIKKLISNRALRDKMDRWENE